MVLLSVSFIVFSLLEFKRFYRLSKYGTETRAYVISYEPEYHETRDNMLVVTRWHKLKIDGQERLVILPGVSKEGTTIPVLYSPKDKRHAAAGERGDSVFKLMDRGLFDSCLRMAIGIMFLFVFLSLFVFGKGQVMVKE